jgi:hypothetical protein
MRHGSSDLRNLLSRIGGAGVGVSIGVIDGVPDLSSPELLDVDLSVEPVMLPQGRVEPDAHGTEICSLIVGREFGFARRATALALPIFFRKPGGGRA